MMMEFAGLRSAQLVFVATQQTQLITALADDGDGDEPDAIAQTYLSGAPVRHWP